MNSRPKNARPSPLATLRRLTGAAVLMLVAAGCAGDEVPLPCPQIVVVKDAARQVHFVGEGRDLTDVVFEARIDGAGVACEYDDNIIEVDMRVRLEAVRGPAAAAEAAEVSYFVAVARLDQTILAREQFDSVVPLPGNKTRAAVEEEVSPRIPIDFQESGSNYRIYIGLALSEEELQYNKANR